ncbi:M48 family metallopeptidase [Aureivirga sp. CE67]|uniref:M48 family metallopeptidase n=1 Tax=Aureivirga sp. CE67 TaxID=1788983 RepID=UPI0018C9669C|nr:M48 family metallopeptidase [Aureivirga sp. CE67]
MKKTLLVFLILFSFFSFNSLGQNTENTIEYSYNNFGKKEALIKRIEEIYKQKKKASYTKEHEEELEKFLDKSLKRIKSNLEDSTYIFNEELNSKLNNILQKIVKNNSSNTQEHTILINKSLIPNAAAYGNGLFVVNLGLIYLLDNEDELAFVLCHELAHQNLEHSKQKTDSIIHFYNSKKTKDEVEKIKNLSYGKGKAGRALLKKIRYDITSTSRVNEFAADEYGKKYYLNSGYKEYFAYTSMKKMELIEELIFSKKIAWDSIFSFKNYKFKKHLLEEEEEEMSFFDSDATLDDFEENNPDSLRTHPHIKDRILRIKGEIKDTLNIPKTINSSFKKYKTLAEKLIIKSYIDQNYLDVSFYMLANKLNAENNTFYIDEFSRLLIKLYRLKSKLALGKYVDQPSNSEEKSSLDEIRMFMNNSSIKDIRELIEAYEKHYGLELKI